jgi:hypothetical protein
MSLPRSSYEVKTTIESYKGVIHKTEMVPYTRNEVFEEGPKAVNMRELTRDLLTQEEMDIWDSDGDPFEAVETSQDENEGNRQTMRRLKLTLDPRESTTSSELLSTRMLLQLLVNWFKLNTLPLTTMASDPSQSIHTLPLSQSMAWLMSRCLVQLSSRPPWTTLIHQPQSV